MEETASSESSRQNNSICCYWHCSAFYGSTRTYSPVFEIHGYEGLSDKLHAAQKAGDIAKMVSMITDDILDHYMVAATWDTLAATMVERYQGIAPNLRVMSYTAYSQYREDPAVFDRWADVARAMSNP